VNITASSKKCAGVFLKFNLLWVKDQRYFIRILEIHILIPVHVMCDSTHFNLHTVIICVNAKNNTIR